MIAEKIQLSGAKETLLITLYGKALESRMPDSILRDRFADDAVRQVDYDFGTLMVGDDIAIGVALRAKALDSWTEEFIASNRDAIVLNLGCGLDSRVFRIDPPESVQWFDVDFPDVIELRERLYPHRDGCHLLRSSVTNPDWLSEVPSNRPAMIVAEGLMPYLAENEVRPLIERLIDHFPAGQIAFDGYSRFGLRILRLQPSLRATGAAAHWAIDDPLEIEHWNLRLKLIAEHNVYDSPAIKRMSWLSRIILPVWNRIPALRRVGRLLRYQF